MKAVLVKEFGGPDRLIIEEVPSPKPDEDQVVISVHYAGLNFPDTLIIQGLYQFKPEFPFSPGGEVSGIVKEVGKNVTHVKVGDRVMSGCSWGGFAEEVVSFGSNTFKLPEKVDFKNAAVLLLTYATTYHALVDKARAQRRETILVLGAAGGTGTSAIHLAKILGLKVIASASTEEKLSYCKEQGADHILLANDPDFRKKLKDWTAGKDIDIVYDPVGGAQSEVAFRSLGFNGRHLVIGFASGEIPRLPWSLPIMKSASIIGVFWGRFFREHPEQNAKNVKTLIEWLESEKIEPHIQNVINLEQASIALNQMLNRIILGKIVIHVA
ncbi:MAG: NADPH:quinone oxidoreductase family protein [Cytophagales bacterium]|nr:NADPH:quinone oxidoreductase family protein [Cytophagales bacterium]